MAGKFELSTDNAGQYRWRYCPATATSSPPASGQVGGGAQNGIESVRTNAPGAPTDDLTESKGRLEAIGYIAALALAIALSLFYELVISPRISHRDPIVRAMGALG